MTAIVWENEPVQCKHLKTLPSSIRCGDFILFNGELCRVETIQRDCPRIENLSSKFTMFTLKTRSGEIKPADSVVGQRDVYRKVWR